MSPEVSLDLSLFEEVPAPTAHLICCRLSLSRRDQLSQNDAFHQELAGRSEFHFRISPDRRTISLSSDAPCNLSFSPAGVRTHHPLAQLLRDSGLELPLSYRMSWNESLSCWIGQYEGLPMPPTLKRPAPRRRKRPGS